VQPEHEAASTVASGALVRDDRVDLRAVAGIDG
jgi:hypothetical protein